MSSESKYIDIKESTLHYLEQGSGDPILFLHGMPVSAHLWRHVMPHFADRARCIAPDLIGMGLSGKPDIDYTVFDHIDYIEAFIQTLDLHNITLVVHGWGSVIGLECARRDPARFKALVCFESHLRPVTDWNMLSLPVQELGSLLQRPEAAYQAVMEENYLIRKLLPQGVIRKLSEEEIAVYEAPFPTIESRKPLWQYVQDLPLGDGPDAVVDLIEGYSAWLQQNELPKLLIYAVPGFITTIETVQWARDNIPNITLDVLEDALHFPQEMMPDAFADVIKVWLNEHVSHSH